MLPAGLLLRSCSVCHPGSLTGAGTAHHGLGPGTSIIYQENAPEACLKAHVIEVPVSQMIQLSQVDKNLTRTQCQVSLVGGSLNLFRSGDLSIRHRN